MENQMSTFSPTAPHFFKVILPESVQSQTQQIPENFVCKYRELLGEKITIKVPTGEEWVVMLRKHRGDIWLSEGWAVFAKYYGLSPGYFLVFRHEGNSYFHVIIFDTSALEINYPFEVIQNNEPHVSEDEGRYSDSYSDDILEGTFYDKGKGKMPKKFAEKRNQLGSRGSSSCMIHEKEPTIRAFQKVRALERASDYESENPFCVVIMQWTYVCGKYMNIPYLFASEHLGKDRMELTLRTYDGRAWEVEYVGSPKPKITLGWKKFVLDNELKKGDVCRFEFKRCNMSCVIVVIFSADADADADA